MTDAELRDAAVAALKETTVSGVEYQKRLAAGKYPNPLLTKWGQALNLLSKIDQPVTPLPPGGRTPLPPVGPFRVESGDHFYRDGDGLLTEKLEVPSAPGYGIGNMRWDNSKPDGQKAGPPSTGTWVLRDCKAHGVNGTPGAGTDGAGFWVGERCQGARLEAWDCFWMGMYTGANCKGSRFVDVNLHDNPLIGLYMEHISTDVEFKRSSFGSVGGTSSSINVEWWYQDAEYGPRLPYNGRAGSFSCRFIDCEIYCPASSDYRVAGAFLDAGTFDFLFQNCRFYGPGKSVGHPRNLMDASKPNRFVDCVFENAGGGPYLHDHVIG